MSLTPTYLPVIPRLKRDSMIQVVKKGVRIDGRKLDEYRRISIELNPIPKAEGSATVKLGNTMVMAGVKIELGEPYRDRPKEGVLQVHAEFVPLASPGFEPGPPDENAIETARVIDRCIREPKAVSLDKLVIIPGRRVWIVFNDIYLLDYDGNVVDAGMLASMAALHIARLPRITGIEGDNVVVDKGCRSEPLPLNTSVVTVSIAKIGGYLLVDPVLEEEVVADAKITIGIDRDERIVGIQKTGMSGFTLGELDEVVELAIRKSRELFSVLEKVLKEANTSK